MLDFVTLQHFSWALSNFPFLSYRENVLFSGVRSQTRYDFMNFCVVEELMKKDTEFGCIVGWKYIMGWKCSNFKHFLELRSWTPSENLQTSQRRLSSLNFVNWVMKKISCTWFPNTKNVINIFEFGLLAIAVSVALPIIYREKRAFPNWLAKIKLFGGTEHEVISFLSW